MINAAFQLITNDTTIVKIFTNTEVINVTKKEDKFEVILKDQNTVIADNPQLTSRIEGGRDPFRIIVDSNLRIPIDSSVVKNPDKKTIVATTVYGDKEKRKKLEELGVTVLEVKEKDKRVDLKDLMVKLGEMKIDSILIEGGGTLNFSALNEGIVDKVRFYIAPKIIGGKKSKTSVEGEGIKDLRDCINLNKINIKRFDEDIMIEGYIDK